MLDKPVIMGQNTDCMFKTKLGICKNSSWVCSIERLLKEDRCWVKVKTTWYFPEIFLKEYSFYKCRPFSMMGIIKRNKCITYGFN